jgi:hypothetical protein
MGGKPLSPPADAAARDPQSSEVQSLTGRSGRNLKRQRAPENQQGGCDHGSKKSRTGGKVPALQTHLGKLM